MAGKQPAAAADPDPQIVRPAPSRDFMTRLLKREFKKDELVEILAKFSEIESLSAQSSMGQPGGTLVGIQTPTPYVVGQQHGGAPEGHTGAGPRPTD
ncbi:hypothetical protein QJS04_geneDACA004497 [Acorus gramineus]|uniref:Uncharacterized protein n=1 Tax=Acorus gramineus TaxID=55184 RepID=A0AAV9B473_ACOGR|nr:hypothetical protein QJS04_geneDACA004497 [Acorus gramineus]